MWRKTRSRLPSRITCTPWSVKRKSRPCVWAAQLENRSETDTYRIELRLGSTGDAIAEPVELAPGKSVKTITLLEAMDYGNYDCTAVITASRNGETIGSMEIETTLHVAYLWAEEG